MARDKTGKGIRPGLDGWGQGRGTTRPGTQHLKTGTGGDRAPASRGFLDRTDFYASDHPDSGDRAPDRDRRGQSTG